MEEEKSFTVNGFRFEDVEEAKQAKLEQSKIIKIEEKLDTKNPEMISMIYQKAIENHVFKTIVGYEFLKKMQNYLRLKGQTDIKSIPVVTAKKIKEVERTEYINKDINKEKIETLNNRIKTYRYVVIVLFILVVTVIAISFTGNRPTVLNYERTLQNKYATWEEQLKEREEHIRQKEKELKIVVE